MFDVLVIGKGMLGSAAARHLSDAGARVAIIGPDEPAGYATHPGIFASHYDQGRLAHRSARLPAWAHLAARSLAAYPTIEARSGVRFHTSRGTLSLVRDGARFGYTAHRAQIERELGFQYQVLPSPEAVRAAFPSVACPAGCTGLLDPPPTGFINPRALIRAELTIAEAGGAQIIPEIVADADTSGGRARVTTRAGEVYTGGAILVATGAYGGCFELLPQRPALTVKSEVVTLAEVGADGAAALADLPAMMVDLDSPAISEAYLVPPVAYPDGRVCLKLGSNAALDRELRTLAEIQAWMRAGDDAEISAHQRATIEQLFPAVRFTSFSPARCMITRTPTGLPYIDQIGERVFVALGGNGAAAKSSDTLGELAALLVGGRPWPAPFQREAFRMVAA